jgi:DNA repair protein RadC
MQESMIIENEGHRERLRHRFLKTGLESFHDYEIVELLLTLGMPRKDCKIQAKDLLAKFGSLRRVLEADVNELQQVRGVGGRNIFGLKLGRALAERLLKEEVTDRPAVRTARDVCDYLAMAMRDLPREVFKTVFLNAQHRVLAVEDLAQGTVDSSAVYPREIMRRALELHATGVICVHNHPAGDPRPSDNDRQVTRLLVAAGQLMGVRLVDHVIIGSNAYHSFAEQGLVQQYEGRTPWLGS